MPQYEELGVKSLWDMLKKDREFSRYFPTYEKEKTLPERDYFYDVLGTLRPAYLERIVAFANKQRGKKGERPEKAMIACNPLLLDELKNCGSYSSKLFGLLISQSKRVASCIS